MAWKFSQRSLNNLKGVHPHLVEVITKALAVSPYDFTVTCGLRSLEEQARLKRQGKSQTMKSYHLPQVDGWGHAVDIAVWKPATATTKSQITWDNKYYVEVSKVVLQIAADLGYQITWGGSWKTLYDTPHYQLEPRSKPIGR